MVKPSEPTPHVPEHTLERWPNAGEYVAEALKEEGVEYIFGVMGGHEWPWLDPITRSGIKHITFRHEQSAGYCAEAYSRVSGKIGVCNVTVGPGATNILSAVHQAHLSNTPILVLSADHECSHDGLETLQECYAETIYSSFCIVSKRIIHNSQYKYWIRRAIRESMRPPKRGPSVLIFEIEALCGPVNPASFYLENFTKEPITVPYPDPKLLKKAVELIYKAKRPAMFVGDGVMWSRAGKLLVEFAELAKVPVLGRRGGRGAIPEDHPMCFKSAAQVIGKSDLFILLGAKLDFYDFWGLNWKINDTIQINDDHRWIYGWLPTELSIISDAGAFLSEALNYIKEKGLNPPSERDDWIREVQGIEAKRKEHLLKNAERFKDRKPIHGLYLAKVIGETIKDLYNNEVIYCGDSFTGWNMTSPYVICKHEGWTLDAGQQAGVGHGVGQAIGAAFATDRKVPVFAMMGDAGVGLAGMDIETAVRHKLPIVYCVYNNDLWFGGTPKFWGPKMEAAKPATEFPPNYFLENIRYDKMFEYVGCHGEWVESADQIRPALERAFKAAEKGQPAVVNVDVSNEPIQAICDSPLVIAYMLSHLPWKEIPVIHRKMRRKYMADVFPFDKYGIELEEYDRYERAPNDFDLPDMK